MKNIWRIKLGIWISVFALVLPLSVQAQTDEWVINHFHADIEIQEDGYVMVHEALSVDFDVYKHGIFRFIPIVYRTNTGDRQRIELVFEEVLIDGEAVPYATYRSGADLVAQIGDPNRRITGEHLYEISYTVDRALLHFEEYDELYWNVTGHDHEAELMISTAAVTLPNGAGVEQISCYAGLLGSTTSCGVAEEDGVMTFAAEGEMTIAIGFTKGIVPVPTWQDQVLWFLADNWFGFIPLLFVAALGLFWWKTGRDPKLRKSVIAQYEPPALPAIYVGLLRREGRLYPYDRAVMLIDLARRGYLKIKVYGKTGTGYRLTALRNPDGLDAAHTLFYNMLFPAGKNSVTLSEVKARATQKKVQELGKLIEKEMVDRNLLTKNYTKRRIFFILLGSCMIGLNFFLIAFAGVFTIAMLFVAACICFVYAWFASKVTPNGLEQLWYVEGLYEFIHRAERYRIQWEEKEGVIAEYLPHAIAFRQTKHWAKALKDIFGEKELQTDWIESTQAITMRSLLAMTPSMTTAIAGSTAPAAPSGSGSSGGGFSGGGFGGGGTGSW